MCVSTRYPQLSILLCGDMTQGSIVFSGVAIATTNGRNIIYSVLFDSWGVFGVYYIDYKWVLSHSSKQRGSLPFPNLHQPMKVWRNTGKGRRERVFTAARQSAVFCGQVSKENKPIGSWAEGDSYNRVLLKFQISKQNIFIFMMTNEWLLFSTNTIKMLFAFEIRWTGMTALVGIKATFE